jgi:hypothetical protein
MTDRHDVLLFHLLYAPTTSLVTTHPRDLRVFEYDHRRPVEVLVGGVWQ